MGARTVMHQAEVGLALEESLGRGVDPSLFGRPVSASWPSDADVDEVVRLARLGHALEARCGREVAPDEIAEAMPQVHRQRLSFGGHDDWVPAQARDVDHQTAPVACLDDGRVWPDLRTCAKDLADSGELGQRRLDIVLVAVRRVVLGLRSTCYGKRFSYVRRP